MADKLYVNKPGGVIVHLSDGSGDTLSYGQEVPDNLADHVDPSAFADSTPRVSSSDQALERARDAARTAGVADGVNVNSSMSPVPSNYGDLDEDGATLIVLNLARYPEQQAAVIKHEILFGGNRTKVVDAASEYAVISANSQIAGLLATQQAQDVGKTADAQPVASPGDPGLARPGIDNNEGTERYARQAAIALGAEAIKSGNPPSFERSGDSSLSEAPPAAPSLPDGTTVEAITAEREAAQQALSDKDAEIERLRSQLANPSGDALADRHGADDAGIQDAHGFDGASGVGSEGYYTNADLDKYASQHEVSGYPASGNRDAKLKALADAGHESPQTPKS